MRYDSWEWRHRWRLWLVGIYWIGGALKPFYDFSSDCYRAPPRGRQTSKLRYNKLQIKGFHMTYYLTYYLSHTVWVIQFESHSYIYHQIYRFFDDVITGQDDVITFRCLMASKMLGWTIAGNKNFWIWTILVLSGITKRTPTFQISTSKKCYKSM